jgi:hypothetical protein
LARHKEEAAAAAAALAADIAEGRLDPAAPHFNQGLMQEGGSEGGAPPSNSSSRPREGPLCLWKPARVAADLALARKLAAVVDAQRGLGCAANPLLPHPPARDGGDDMAVDGGKGERGCAGGGSHAVAAAGCCPLSVFSLISIAPCSAPTAAGLQMARRGLPAARAVRLLPAAVAPTALLPVTRLSRLLLLRWLPCWLPLAPRRCRVRVRLSWLRGWVSWTRC